MNYSELRMNRYTNGIVLFYCFFSLLIQSCSKDSYNHHEIVEVETIIANGDEDYLNFSSEFIFNQDSLFTFELFIPPGHYARLNADPAAEQYYEGQLVFRGDTLSPVGIRYKGSIGAFAGCLSGLNFADPSGKKTCQKLSMKVKVNWLDSDATFYGLKKLQFHSMNHDASQMHERLGYWLFREMGVAAPRSVHAKLIINGEYSGLYALTEQIDGRFTRHHFADGDGNLYKEIWPLNQNGQAWWEKTYLTHLRTNEEENPTAEMIRNFAVEIASAEDDELQTVIQKWMNVEQVVSYVVVDRSIRADDGPFHWYEHRGRIYNHNYYWYEEPTEKKLYLIPWDLDNAFENIMDEVNPITTIADDWGEISANCEPFSYGPLEIKQRSAACDKLTRAWTHFIEEYQSLSEEFLQGPFSAITTDPLLDQWEAQIKEATAEAALLHTDALSLQKWKAGMSHLRKSLQYVRDQ